MTASESPVPTPIPASEPDDRLLLRVPEAAALASISTTKAYELIRKGIWPAITVGATKRVPRRALEAWIEQQLAREWSPA